MNFIIILFLLKTCIRIVISQKKSPGSATVHHLHIGAPSDSSTNPLHEVIDAINLRNHPNQKPIDCPLRLHYPSNIDESTMKRYNKHHPSHPAIKPGATPSKRLSLYPGTFIKFDCKKGQEPYDNGDLGLVIFCQTNGSWSHSSIMIYFF